MANLSDDQIVVLHISLMGSEPEIWRRVSVPGDFTLDKLHRVFQIAMGWDDSHLHQFEIGKRAYVAAWDYEDNYKQGMEIEEETLLCEVIRRKGQKFLYLYDFGDGWQHEVRVEDFGPSVTQVKYPKCLAGECACPPDDCGGIGGYYNMLEALGNRNHRDHETYRDWISGDFDPDAFSLGSVNKKLSRMRAKS